MTEDELDEIEARYAKNAPIFGIEPDIPALLAEARRLRAALVEERARGNWAEDWAVTDGAGIWADLDTYRFGDGGRVSHRARARAELLAEGLLPRD